MIPPYHSSFESLQQARRPWNMTKAGLRVAGYISRRTSTVEGSITSHRVNRNKMWINQV